MGKPKVQSNCEEVAWETFTTSNNKKQILDGIVDMIIFHAKAEEDSDPQYLKDYHRGHVNQLTAAYERINSAPGLTGI